MPNIIDTRQSACIEGRHHTHSAVVATKVVDEARRERKKHILFKVDNEKAYDLVSWEFLWYMLQRLGFCLNVVSGHYGNRSIQWYWH